MYAVQSPSSDEWQLNLIKDGGRRVMYGGNAYEDDLEPAAGPAEPGRDQLPEGAGQAAT